MKKIFTEGIGEADAILVVLSRHSISKPWVAEELDAAVVRRIQEDTKLIPIVLDDLAATNLPVAVRHLLYEPVADTSRFQQALDRVVRAVLA